MGTCQICRKSSSESELDTELDTTKYNEISKKNLF